MKSSAPSSLYFSAYPLKALIQEPSAQPAASSSLYLKSTLNGKTKTLSRVRVFPMTDPYRPVQHIGKPFATRLPKDIELSQREWFNNYE